MKKKRTDWLSTLLHSKFFGSCIQHQEHRKNEENVFCLDCSLGICRHCTTDHGLHRRLQICKYVYHDVVRLQEMQKHLDCSKIQVFSVILSIWWVYFFFCTVVTLKMKPIEFIQCFKSNSCWCDHWIFLSKLLCWSFWLFVVMNLVNW